MKLITKIHNYWHLHFENSEKLFNIIPIYTSIYPYILKRFNLPTCVSVCKQFCRRKLYNKIMQLFTNYNTHNRNLFKWLMKTKIFTKAFKERISHIRKKETKQKMSVRRGTLNLKSIIKKKHLNIQDILTFFLFNFCSTFRESSCTKCFNRNHLRFCTKLISCQCVKRKWMHSPIPFLNLKMCVCVYF